MQLDLAEECSALYVDGTFKSVKNPYKQLFSIHSFLRSGENIKQVPLVNVIMSRRTKTDYDAVFCKLKMMLGDEFKPESCMADYESACWKSMRDNFPSMQMHGCLFHFSQAINKNVIRLGLIKDYKTPDSTIRNLIRGVYSLPYLPPRDMYPAFETLKSQASEEPCENSEKLQEFFRCH